MIIVYGAIILLSVIVIVINCIGIVRNLHKIRIHNQATEWYDTHPYNDPKPDYVLESERLRTRSGLR